MYRTLSPGVFCAEKVALAPYIGSSVAMNNSPTTISPISYCVPAQTSSYACTDPLDAPQSSLVQTLNTCTQTINIMSEADICNILVNDMSAADCNGLIALYNSA